MEFGASTVVTGRRVHENEAVRTAPRLIAWGSALAAVALIAAGLVLDRIAAAQHIPRAGSVWLYPLRVAAISAPAVVGALIAVSFPTAGGTV
jgi:hypothetical protein